MSASIDHGAPARSVTVVVPTFREVASLPSLLERLEAVRRTLPFALDLVLVDDDSRDGTVELVTARGLPWVQLVVRTQERGLSSAVLEGLRRASGDVLVVMDADLSHPPERIPELVRALEQGHDFAIGSRYVAGGTTGEDWGVLRWLNSKVATLLARPFTRASDPMSGFFALRRTTFQAARDLNPVGYKIGLELMVKCAVKRAAEVPIHFAQRQHGESKLSFREQLRYLQHLRRLFIYRYPGPSYLAQFVTVGATGVLVNLGVLTLLLALGMPVQAAVAVAILVSMLGNFVLNRRFTFSYARHGNLLAQLGGFVLACSAGAALNYGVTVGILALWPHLLPQLAALAGVVSATAINFLISRYLVFRRRPQRGESVNAFTAAHFGPSSDARSVESPQNPQLPHAPQSE